MIKLGYKWIWERGVFLQSTNNSSANVGETYGKFLEIIRIYGYRTISGGTI